MIVGLDLRLDRSNESWGVRQLFFKAGDTVVEFGASLTSPAGVPTPMLSAEPQTEAA